jgi:hypothetical protein
MWERGGPKKACPAVQIQWILLRASIGIKDAFKLLFNSAKFNSDMGSTPSTPSIGLTGLRTAVCRRTSQTDHLPPLAPTCPHLPPTLPNDLQLGYAKSRSPVPDNAREMRTSIYCKSVSQGSGPAFVPIPSLSIIFAKTIPISRATAHKINVVATVTPITSNCHTHIPSPTNVHSVPSKKDVSIAELHHAHAECIPKQSISESNGARDKLIGGIC